MLGSKQKIFIVDFQSYGRLTHESDLNLKKSGLVSILQSNKNIKSKLLK